MEKRAISLLGKQYQSKDTAEQVMRDSLLGVSNKKRGSLGMGSSMRKAKGKLLEAGDASKVIHKCLCYFVCC